ncbi:MAG: DNA translocase FtsK 4TM domain-containing protein [Lentimicrobiaceae bacterium]|nr:DNA translocase FtsK 4TM domain-containing protein [Lentimicrobiaceae bacterium]
MFSNLKSLALKENNSRKNTLRNDKKSSSAGNGKKVRPPRKEKGPGFFRNEKVHQATGIILLAFALFLAFAFVSYFFSWAKDDAVGDISFKRILSDNSIHISNWTGRLGAALAHQFIKEWFGVASFLFILILLATSLRLIVKTSVLPVGKTIIYSVFGILWISIALGFFMDQQNELYTILAGSFGYWSVEWLKGLVGNPGIILMLVGFMLIFLIVAINLQIMKYFRRRPREERTDLTEKVLSSSNELQNDESITENSDGEAIRKEWDALREKDQETFPKTAKDDLPAAVEFEIRSPGADKELETEGDNGDMPHYTIDTLYDPTLDLPHYQFPPLNLLNDYKESQAGVNKEELEANKNRIVETLNNYLISIDKITATIGPAVTLYEIVPSPGIRISKIKNLEDDIALSLSALGIRIIAPLPGKGTIGIEVPNKNPEIVSIKSILSSDKFQNSKYALPFGIGKTISNESYIADLTKMPHILMAGATGQGKSVGLNAILASLLYKKHPAQVKFVLVDPKKVELTLFSKIERHFLAKLPDVEEAIITNTRQVVRTLNSLNIEMDSRYDLLKDAQVRNIQEYNGKFIERKLNPNEGHRYLPYIVVVVDEFADLIMTAGKEIETPLTRLAQLARAIGIHLILATQRPSVNIITGTIKANFPARIAYRVISKIDSRTILDSSGADQLIGRGDMLLSTGNDLVRLQCAFVDIEEVDRITEFIGAQRGYPDAFYLPEYLDEEDEANKDFDPSQRDELFEDAARVVVQHQHGSTSLLQRKLKLGYNRAGRIIDQLEAAGIVGPFEGSKAREVKVKNEMALEQLLRDLRENL